MKLIVNPHKVEIDKEEAINEKEINISLCKFEFADEITDDYVKEAYFTYNGESYKQIIVNNMCTFPQEVLVKEGTVELGVVATYTDLISGEITRYNPSPVYFKTDLGSLRDAQNSEPITPSEMEQYEQALQDGLTEVNSKLDAIDDALDEVDNLDIDANKVDNVTTVTITDKLGDTKTVQILDGTNGTDGKDGIDGKDGKDGIDGTNGVDGYSPIASVSKSDNVATITITDKNGTTTATVSDGINGTNGRDGVDGQDGRDGYVQYTAGENIIIDENNVISAVGGDLSNYYTKNEANTKFQDKLQYGTMPIASEDNVGKIIQYVGETTQNYKNGNWYKCDGNVYEKLDGVSVSYDVYIDTGIIPSNHKIEVSFAWNSYINDSHILGTSNTGSDPAWYIHFTSFSNKYYWGRNGQEANGGSFTTGEHIVVFNDGEDNELKIDGTVLDRNLCASPKPLELFRRSGNANFYGTFHYLKIWDKTTGNLIMNLIPVLNENSELIFMNTVTNEILTPIGPGSITAGTPTGETFGIYEWELTDNNIDSRIWIGSQTDYNNMESHNENTLYFID